MTDDTVFIEGRSRDTAMALLAAAEKLGHPLSVVRTTTNGYTAPADVAKAFEKGVDYKPAKKAEPVVEVAPEPEPEPELEVEAEEQLVDEADEADDVDDQIPAKNASLEAWIAYAETKGYDIERGLTRNELIDEYGQN